MKANILSPFIEPFSRVLRNKERLLAALIILCFVVNGLIPRHFAAVKDHEVLAQIMQRQSVLLRFFSFSSLPVKLVNELFSEYHDMAAGTPKRAPADERKKAADTSADYSLVSFEKTGANRSGFAQRVAEGLPALSGVFRPLPAAPDTAGKASPPGERYALLLLVLFFFLLPRSSLSEGAVRALSFRGYGTRPARARRVFFLPGKTGGSRE